MAESTSTTSSTDEQWRPVVGFEGLYSVSNLGRARRETDTRNNQQRGRAGAIVAGCPDPKGYIRFRLWKSGESRLYSAHRLIAHAFLGTCPPGWQVNHKDCRKANNQAGNLEYTSGSENMRHAARSGVLGQAKLKPQDVRRVRDMLRSGHTQKQIAAFFRVTPHLISGINCGKIWGHFESIAEQPIAALRGGSVTGTVRGRRASTCATPRPPAGRPSSP